MARETFLATTALVLCVSASFAGQKAGSPVDVNARFLSYFMPGIGSKVLYAQSASSGFSTYAISATNFTSSGFCCFGNIAADDFIIPGTGTHRITAVYAPGVNVSGQDPMWMSVTFYDKLKYSDKTGITTAVAKASCPYVPFSDVTGNGSMLVDVSSCKLGKFESGHDYALAVQADSGEENGYVPWAWRTNRSQIKRQAFYFTYGYGNGPCKQQFTPVKTCFPASGYGPDLAFAIYGK